jgi:cell division protein FtsL
VAPGPAPASTQSSPGAAFSTGASAAVSGAAAGLAGVASSVTSAWNNRSANKPEKQPKQKSPKVRRSSKRQAMLTLSRVEPWSVMKFSFLASVVAFVILFVAVAVLYMVLSLLGVFDSLQHTVSTLTSSKNSVGTNISHYYSASLILGYTAMLGALNIVLITAMSTVGSVIYNLIAKTVGGIEVTLRETD